LKTLRNPHFWIIIFLFAAFGLLQYADRLGFSNIISPSQQWELTLQSIGRLLLLIPIIYADWVFGFSAGLIATISALVVSLPRTLFISPVKMDAVLEMITVTLVGIFICFLTRLKNKEHIRAAKAVDELENIRKMLQHNLEALTISEKRLEMLNVITERLYGSFNLEEVFGKAVHLVSELMSADVTLLFVIDESRAELELVAYEGVSEEFALAMKWIKVGEGVYGEVSKNGSPVIIENTKTSFQSRSDEFQKMKIEVQLVIPLLFQARVIGIVCVASRRPRQFSNFDADLMTSIGREIAVAIENARLYGIQRRVTEQLTQSEAKYRRLFELASDAIFITDLNGRLIEANRASAELMGDSLEGVIGTDIRQFLSPIELENARHVRSLLLLGQPFPQPYEQKLVRNDKTEVILMISSNLIKHDDEPPVFEHVARDVSKERRMQDNLRHYVQQITRIQEEERNRIARDLHDDTVQTLYALTRQVDNFIRSSVNLPVEASNFLKGLIAQINTTSQEVRRFSQDLRPPLLDDLGLVATIRWLAGDMEHRTHIVVKLTVSGKERRLAPHIELAIFRMIQEALRNVEKHALATQVDVNIEYADGKINISIVDNGKGFKLTGDLGELPREGRLGLMGMKERANLIGGNITIKSEIDHGSQVLIELPG
jgi:PAS domain S-box-containing protein